MRISRIVLGLLLPVVCGQAHSISFDSATLSLTGTPEIPSSLSTLISGLAETDGTREVPILRIFQKDDTGARHSTLVVDIAGNGSNPSPAFMTRDWAKGLPDKHYTVIGTITITASGQDVTPTPIPVPLPPAAWLFGSGLSALLLLQGHRRNSAT